MALFYPSCVVNLMVRFDKAYHVKEALTPETVPDRTKIPRLEGVQSEYPLLLQPGADELTQIAGIVPKSWRVELPGHRQAGTFSLTFDYRRFPVDPRLVKSMAAFFYLDTVPAGEFSDGMMGAAFGVGDLRFPFSIIEPSEDNNLGVFLADSVVVKHEAEASTWSCEGRDLRGILIDSPTKPKEMAKLKLGQDLVSVIFDILALHPLAEYFIVEHNPDDWEGRKIPSPITKDGKTRVSLGANGQGGGESKPAGDSDGGSYWDYITKYCALCGAIPTFVGQRLRIRPARSMFDIQKWAGVQPSYRTPFADGAMRAYMEGEPAQQRELSWRRMVYGRDIESLKIERKLGGIKAQPIKVVAIDTSSKAKGTDANGKSKRLIEVVYPTKDDLKKEAGKRGLPLTHVEAPGGQAKDSDSAQIVPIFGVTDKKRLKMIAEDLYNEVMRGEMGGSCSTKNLASFGAEWGKQGEHEGPNRDPDLLRLRPGDPVEFTVDTRALRETAPLVAQVVDMYRKPASELVAEIKKMLGDENLARVVVASTRNLVVELAGMFYVHTVCFDGGGTGELTVSFDFQNYLEARTIEASLTPAKDVALKRHSSPGTGPQVVNSGLVQTSPQNQPRRALK